MTLRQLLSNHTAVIAADLIIDGLGICCFDSRDAANPHWEVAYLRDARHEFELSISEMTLGGEEGNSYPNEILGDFRTIHVIVEGGSNAHYAGYPNGYYKGGAPFERDINGDREDFRWVIDFIRDPSEVEHGTFVDLKQKSADRNRIPVTLLEVPHSLFYTKTLTASPAVFSTREHRDPCETDVLGHTNELVGAAVLTNGPSRIIVQGRDWDGNVVVIKDLEYKPNQYYQIGFKNMDKPKSEAYNSKGIRAASVGKGKLKDYQKGDFERFYDVIGVSGTEKSLWGRKRMEHGRLGDCHVVMVNSTVPTLEPLLD